MSIILYLELIFPVLFLSGGQRQMFSSPVEVVKNQANNHPGEAYPAAVGLGNQYYDPYDS